MIKQHSNDCLEIIQSVLSDAYDTGNFAFNATYKRDTWNGFQIVNDGSLAFYNVFLQEGTVNSTKHKGIINRAFDAAHAYLVGVESGDKNGTNVNKDILAEKAKNTPARDNALLNSLSQSTRRAR